jgi:hypothetical protein
MCAVAKFGLKLLVFLGDSNEVSFSKMLSGSPLRHWVVFPRSDSRKLGKVAKITDLLGTFQIYLQSDVTSH